jgi:hypothetical protein
MKEAKRSRVASMTTTHGSGAIGGKAEGLVEVDQMKLPGVRRLRSEIFTTDFYDRFRDSGDKLDAGCIEYLRGVHNTFACNPIGVRASEPWENDPLLATSGESSSYMLANRHPDPEERFSQFLQAVTHIYSKFARRMEALGRGSETMAFLVNPIPGVVSNTAAGAFFHPMSSGVADSFFQHPLTLADGLQDPREGFARVAFGHGYATVRDDFEVVPIATIKQPLSTAQMSKNGQQLFYALRIDDRQVLADDEMEAMAVLNMKFADPAVTQVFSDARGSVNFSRLVDEDLHGYHSGLVALMEQLGAQGPNFQIEFTWNLMGGEGVFHVVQYKRLREIDLGEIQAPDLPEEALISTDQFQGHGVIEGILHAVVINPFAFQEETREETLRKLALINRELADRGERYIFVCPGRLGTSNPRWGLKVDFGSISAAAAIVEYGFDIRGAASIAVERDEMTGGVYGSHFLYQILGGADEAERRRRARLFGAQGTHFLTNLFTKGTHYLFINPARNHLSPWFFAPPPGMEEEPIYVKAFDRPVSTYANLFEKRCVVYAAQAEVSRTRSRMSTNSWPKVRVLNPHKLTHVYTFAADAEIRRAARGLEQSMASCEVTILSNTHEMGQELHDEAFVLFVDEAAISFLDRGKFKKHNPFGTVFLLTNDLRVASAPTRREVERACPLSRRADLVFFLDDKDCSPKRVLPAAVRYAEDRHNIAYHKIAKRFIFLVVDDELRWFSAFLPMLYRVIGQRADVMTARTFEEAMEVMEEHGSDIVCLITDMYFPKGGVVTAEAGRELVKRTKRDRPRIPIIIASKSDRGRELQDVALILPKGEPGAVETLYQYVHDFTGLADFLFFRDGKPWRRATTLEELRSVVAEAPLDLLEEYGKNDYFSTWLYMHGFRELGDRLRMRQDRGDKLRRILLDTFDQELELLSQQELVLVDAQGETVGRARTVEDLLVVIEAIELEPLEAHASHDIFSMWLMRKGFPDLADQLRPIHGEGEDLRRELLDVLGHWVRRLR